MGAELQLHMKTPSASSERDGNECLFTIIKEAVLQTVDVLQHTCAWNHGKQSLVQLLKAYRPYSVLNWSGSGAVQKIL